MRIWSKVKLWLKVLRVVVFRVIVPVFLKDRYLLPLTAPILSLKRLPKITGKRACSIS